MDISDKSNAAEWEKRSKLWGSSIKSVLHKSLPDIFNEHFHNWHLRIISSTIEKKENLRILDVGCGWGRLTIPIKEMFPDAQLTGLDISENYVRLYKEKTGCEAFVATLEDMPPELGEFDYIICVTVLMYVDDANLKKAVDNLFKHLKVGGKLILIENNWSGVPFQTAFGLLKLFRNKSKKDIETGGRTFKMGEIGRLFFIDGEVKSVRRIPCTTINFLPLYIITRFFPKPVARFFLRAVTFFDNLFGGWMLPSIYIAKVIEQDLYPLHHPKI